MSISQKYREIFKREIVDKSKGIVFTFSPVSDKWEYKPFGHGFSQDAVERLAELMRLNLFFYSYGEEEVVKHYEKDHFASMEQAAKYAYKSRLPKRADITDGLPSEVLLDLLVQIYNPDAYKLAVRTIFRQNDNFEIKGYDLTYFTKDNDGISLWLGQAKLGSKDYCKSDINNDLLEKFKGGYLTKQLFFVADKPVSITEDAKEILNAIEGINIRSMDEDDSTLSAKLLDYFKNENIRIKIPCLLAYGEESVYKDPSKVFEMIENETESIRKYFSKHQYVFSGFSPEIIFYVFPIESIERLRDKEKGFYAGLC